MEVALLVLTAVCAIGAIASVWELILRLRK